MAQRIKIDRLLARLPSLADIVRGSLLHRTTFHSRGCAKCARGRGHPQWVLNVNYPGGKNRQVSLHRDRCLKGRRGLRNSRKRKKPLAPIAELNRLYLATRSPQPPTRRD